MQNLLSVELRVMRLRRRRDEFATWTVREAAPVTGWTFAGAPIALGDPWPDIVGVQRFESGAFAVPEHWPLAQARLGLNVGGECLLTIRYDGRAAVQLGLDPNHLEFPLDARTGRLTVEGVARAHLGAPSRDPRMIRAELVWVEAALIDFLRAVSLVAETAEQMPDHEVTPMLLDVAETALSKLRWPTATADVLGRESRFAKSYLGRDENPRHFEPMPLGEDARVSVAEADALLRQGLRGLQARYPQSGAIAYVGHAHIDTAWLWPIEETRRKVMRTFSTQVDLINKHPGFRFAQSFAEYYKDLETRDPALLDQIKAHVASGRWEPVGGFWVEPDINMLAGESLVRQALYGQRYFEKTFGRRHTVSWLPDTFGFSAALPQILKGAGLTGMYTVKIGWSETNVFPHTRFWWEGIDGSRVLVNQMNRPEDNYNGAVTPEAMLRLWRNHSDKAAAPEAFQPIGWGDGGGGPTHEQVARFERLGDFPVLPKLRFTGVTDYFDTAQREAEQTTPSTWVGELYLEYHRGVLTSQGRTKQLNRKAERALVGAEVVASLAALAGGPSPSSLEDHWCTLMVNQFHDILPGSSIGDVYKRTERELGEVVAAADAVAAASLGALASGAAEGATRILMVNPDLSPRPIRLASPTPIPGGQPAEDGYILASDQTVGPLSVVTAAPAPATGVTVQGGVLENRYLRVEIAADGTLASVYDKRFERQVLDGRGNQIWAYHDQPRDYDAWDIEEDYARSGAEVLASGPLEIIEPGGQRGAIRVTRTVGASTIVQSMRLWANSARIDFRTRIDWHDRRILLKARFPLLIRSDTATFECAFGVVRRPTHRNTSWDAAKFEVPAHRFVDLSEVGYGAALLNDGRYGAHALGAELGISLLKSPILPDRLADEGAHDITYSLLPHGGDWAEGGVLAEAEDLNRPLYHQVVGGAGDAEFAPVKVSGTAVALGALKPAEDDDGLILRLYEPHGARGPIAVEAPPGWTVTGEVNLLEDAAPDAGWITPFQIRSWRLRKG